MEINLSEYILNQELDREKEIYYIEHEIDEELRKLLLKDKK